MIPNAFFIFYFELKKLYIRLYLLHPTTRFARIFNLPILPSPLNAQNAYHFNAPFFLKKNLNKKRLK